MTNEIETINPLDDTARINWHRDAEADSAEVAPEAMTDAELVAVIIHDADIAARRKALHVLRLREFNSGLNRSIDIIMSVPA